MKKAEVDVVEMYSVTIGHNGYFGREYDGGEEWSATYLGKSYEDIAIHFSNDEDFVLKDRTYIKMSKVQAIIYEGKVHVHNVIENYNLNDASLREQRDGFFAFLGTNAEAQANIARIKKAKADEIDEQEREELERIELSDMAMFERLKVKYGIDGKIQKGSAETSC